MKQIITLFLFLTITLTYSTNFLYQQFTHQFVKTAHINEIGEVKGGTIFGDSTIFLTCKDGLRAFNYDGKSFSNKAYISYEAFGAGAIVISDGIIFIANGYGIRAFKFDGNSFSDVGHIDNGGWAFDIDFSDDGTIFLANGYGGIRAYTFDGSSFTNTAHRDYYGYAGCVKVASDGIIFHSNEDSLYADKYDGTSFSSITEIVLSTSIVPRRFYSFDFSKDGKIFVTDSDLLRVFSFDGILLTNIANVTLEYEIEDLLVSEDGTLFISNSDGLGAYTFDGSSFTTRAYLNVKSQSSIIDVSSDGTIFLSDGDSALVAYEYSPITSVEVNEMPTKYSLSQNYPNPFNPSTTIKYSIPSVMLNSFQHLKDGEIPKQVRDDNVNVSLKVYDILGREVATLVNEKQKPGNYKVSWDADNVPSGVYFYKLSAGDFIQTKKMLMIK